MGNLTRVIQWVSMNVVIIMLLFNTFTCAIQLKTRDGDFEAKLSKEIEEFKSKISHGHQNNFEHIAPNMSRTISGILLCSGCSNKTTPLFGVKAKLLCPHPPSGEVEVDPRVHTVSSAITSADGSFHLAANASYEHIMDRCVVNIENSNSNCDIPPLFGTNLFMSTNLSVLASGNQQSNYSIGSFSFPPTSCSKNTTRSTPPRNLLQGRKTRIGVDQIYEKKKNITSENNTTSGKRHSIMLPRPFRSSINKNTKVNQLAEKPRQKGVQTSAKPQSVVVIHSNLFSTIQRHKRETPIVTTTDYSGHYGHGFQGRPGYHRYHGHHDRDHDHYPGRGGHDHGPPHTKIDSKP